jgi:hypothetical protein
MVCVRCVLCRVVACNLCMCNMCEVCRMRYVVCMWYWVR